VGLCGIVVCPCWSRIAAMPAEKVMGTAIWQSLASWTLAALPLFI